MKLKGKGGPDLTFPKETVKILKRWLKDHLDHPYPTTTERIEL